MNQTGDFQKLLEKIQKMKIGGSVDLSREEDLALAVMNLVSLEEHFFFTGSKTGKDRYYDLMSTVREIRKSMLAKLVRRTEGETWCISKHLLAATMRLMEVGTKYHSEGDRSQAKEVFGAAQALFALFWGLRLDLVDVSDVKKIPDDQLNIHDGSKSSSPWTLKEITDKLVDCCKE